MNNRRIGIVGAGGFIGNRLVEMLHLGGHDTRPIARRASGLAMASRFGLSGHVADALDPSTLAEALTGCDIVVHALAGDNQTIRRSVPCVYEAAERAGCRRLVYLSSAMVHGQQPLPGCDETTPLSRTQPIAYNNAKVDAEARLFALRRRGKVEAVALRPGIVYGPRSQWIGGLADSLLANEAYLVDGGVGICNAIFVDNLVEAIIRSFDAPGADGEAFLLGEPDQPTWQVFYARVAAAMGVDIKSVPAVGFDVRSPSFSDRVDGWRRSRPVRAALDTVPRSVSRGLAAFWEASGMLPTPATGNVEPTLEFALLHRSIHVPSWDKARRILGYEPTVPAAEAWRYTLAWLSFAGYPEAVGAHG